MNDKVSVFLNVNLSCSQKRKSEDLNGDATNGQNEVKNEDPAVEEVMHFYVLVMLKHRV